MLNKDFLPKQKNMNIDQKYITITMKQKLSMLKDIAQKFDVDLCTLFKCAWTIILYKYSAETEVGFGFYNLQKNNIDNYNIKIQKNATVKTLLHDIYMQPPTMVSYNDKLQYDTALVNSNGNVAHIESFFHTFSKDVVFISFEENHLNDEFNIQAYFNSSTYHIGILENLLNNLKIFLDTFETKSELTPLDINITSPSEQNTVTEIFNDTPQSYSKQQCKCVHKIFEEQVVNTPSHIAVSYNGKNLTYREVNAQANRVANYLLSRGVQTGSHIGIMLERSIEAIVSIIGILKSGCTYVPLDATYPQERLVFMLKNSNPAMVITHESFQHILPSTYAGTIQTISKILESNVHNTNPNHTCTTEDVAYVIYSSGSTGTPKGIMVPHRGIIRLACDKDHFKFTNTDILTQMSSISFDAATFEIWTALLNGLRLEIVSKDIALDNEKLCQFILDKEITIMFFTTALFHKFVEKNPQALSTLKYLIVGGEALNLTHANLALQYLNEEGYLINGYGPTENTTFSTYYFMNQKHKKLNSILIGTPLTNSSVFILDENLSPLPIGAIGEIYLGGKGVAIGYLHNKELTQEAFIQEHPFQKFGKTLYKTGDLGRWLPDGNIEYLGRKDRQIKIRGFRIEPGEIETVMLNLSFITECVVMDIKDLSGNKKLVAFYVSSQIIRTSELKELLKKSLPEYMIPNQFIQMNNLPVQENGKLDTKTLTSIAHSKYFNHNSERIEQTKPVDLVHALTLIWEELLGVTNIHLEDNFFDLGGDSLQVMELKERVHHKLKHDIPVTAIFSHPTIHSLVKFINGPNDNNIKRFRK
ncbi:amino acid adenylation domain-containing protein [Bacillus sp. SRB3LM]|uniref:non-ribosomal peptide synthetase n=1 Tax=Bacillus sp. SRB3LM TaxID=2608689 RepID=UPI0018C3C182|nr:amino acid adenylation domain-containing protein [Bacillus sp. SRB3LM]MBG0969473.1 non-ribosomal peptide synthetase [Bacillus sp. SRB3LM]MBG0971980.1 non-ribosomal peptide synthetase [Bacillus sp. SRB3LM]MBG0972002.1 non-ribosomal peptide synthetase [Bacillus sp. SRB3LM]